MDLSEDIGGEIGLSNSSFHSGQFNTNPFSYHIGVYYCPECELKTVLKTVSKCKVSRIPLLVWLCHVSSKHPMYLTFHSLFMVLCNMCHPFERLSHHLACKSPLLPPSLVTALCHSSLYVDKLYKLLLPVGCRSKREKSTSCLVVDSKTYSSGTLTVSA